jgi:hypothetical protein
MNHGYSLSTAALLLATQFTGAIVRGADRPTQMPEVVVTGERSAVEQGVSSLFRALPPRDLQKQPLTESPGLDTATSIIVA